MGGGGGRGKGMKLSVKTEKGKATESFLRYILTLHTREHREEPRDEREVNASQTGGEYLDICCT